MPRDALSFAVFVGREIEHVDVFDLVLEVIDDLTLALGHHVERLKIMVDVDADLCPLLRLEFGRNLRR
jgi:hypothetical protein